MTELPIPAGLSTDRIYLSPPDVGVLEEHHLVWALRSGWVAPLGPAVDAFESDLAEYCDRAHCVALSSGTAALHLGLLALGIGCGDIVIVPTMTFAATANAVVYTGATPYFVDSDATGNLDPDLLAEVLADLSGSAMPAAVVTVDLLGKVADHQRIGQIAEGYGLPVLSDAAESLGSSRSGRPAAGHGAAAAVSFNGNKVMTTSGGGALLTDDSTIALTARHLATQARQPVAHYEHDRIGYNYRMSNLLAALGRAQLLRLDGMIGRRRQLRELYKEVFAEVDGVEVFGAEGDQQDNVWLTAILVDSKVTGWMPRDLAAALAQRNIESRPLWKPMHLQPVFAGAPARINGVSESLFAGGLALPSGSVLTATERERVVCAIWDFLRSRR